MTLQICHNKLPSVGHICNQMELSTLCLKRLLIIALGDNCLIFFFFLKTRVWKDTIVARIVQREVD